MKREELERIRGLAAKATPGPWAVQRDDADAGDIYYALYGGLYFDFIGNIHERKYDAAFIAAANPSTITALLDHIDRLERQRDAGFNLRHMVIPDAEFKNWVLSQQDLDAYDTATKETGQ